MTTFALVMFIGSVIAGVLLGAHEVRREQPTVVPEAPKPDYQEIARLERLCEIGDYNSDRLVQKYSPRNEYRIVNYCPCGDQGC